MRNKVTLPESPRRVGALAYLFTATIRARAARSSRFTPPTDHTRISLLVCGIATTGRSFEPWFVRDLDIAA